MSEYKRLTVFLARKAKSGTCLDILSLINELEKENENLNFQINQMNGNLIIENQVLKNRIAEWEKKIENGTLVEFNKPFYSNQLNAWCIYLREGDYITSLCLTKEQAEEYQKELQEE